MSSSPVGTVVCVDFGSTFTKAVLVDLDSGDLLGTASHPTTLPDNDGEGDVLDGYDACLAELTAADARAAEAEVLACSSAGGGLRIAVVGNEELVTAEAGRRVALSSGGRVVAVGTTATRALESATETDGTVHAAAGWTDLVISALRPVRVVNGLVTGWHNPEASHLLLVESVAGPGLTQLAYDAAVEERYLWHEFGDSCLLLGNRV